MKAAVYTGTRNLYPDMVPAVKSLLLRSDVERIFLLIEDDVFPEPLPSCVETINVSGQKFFKKRGPNMKSRYTYMAMMRAALCHVFPDLDRILSLDVDTIAVRNISDIWELPVEDCYFSASGEWHRTREDYLYTNIGVCLYNLEKLRDGKADEVIRALNERKYQNLEQDAFNELCQGAIYNMPGEYNANPWVHYSGRPKIVHYAGIRNWSDKYLVRQLRDTPWAEIPRAMF